MKLHTGGNTTQNCSGFRNQKVNPQIYLWYWTITNFGFKIQCANLFLNNTVQLSFFIHNLMLYWWGGNIKPWNIYRAFKSEVVVKNYLFISSYSIILLDLRIRTDPISDFMTNCVPLEDIQITAIPNNHLYYLLLNQKNWSGHNFHHGQKWV